MTIDQYWMFTISGRKYGKGKKEKKKYVKCLLTKASYIFASIS